MTLTFIVDGDDPWRPGGGLSEEFLAELERQHTYSRRNARPTSRAAGESALPKSGTRRREVYEFICAAGERGATDDEMIAGLHLAHQSVGPRRLELLEAGLICDSGQRRRTATGNPAIVWTRVVTP